MAAVEVTISGVLYDKFARTARPVALIGEAFLTNVGIGGGPIIPPGGGSPDLPHPEHPIVLPDPPNEIPPDTGNGGTIVKPPPPGGGWAFSPEYGWGYFPGSTGAGPKR